MPRTLQDMSTVAERLTADDYLARDDPRRTELIDGAVVVNEPGILHQRVCGLIYRALAAWTQGADGRGTASLPLNVALDADNVLAPDVLWFDGDLPLDAANAPRVPDLAVEVRSPTTWRFDIGRKRDLYERHGVRELWLVDPYSRSVLVFRRATPEAPFATPLEVLAEETIGSPQLPGFAAVVGELIPAPA
jgi:Uma2 family endonuclease